MTFAIAWELFLVQNPWAKELGHEILGKIEAAFRKAYEQGYIDGGTMQRKLLRQRIGLSEDCDK